MRIIDLVEANIDTELKILFADQMMWNIEKSGLSPHQLGGRANRSAPDCTTRKVIK